MGVCGGNSKWWHLLIYSCFSIWHTYFYFAEFRRVFKKNSCYQSLGVSTDTLFSIRTWIQELQLHDSFSLMEKSRSSNIQEMKFALAQKSSDSFCNTLKLNDNTYAGFQIYKNVPLPESTLTWGGIWRRWKNAGGKIPWIQNARYLSCIFQSCKMLSPKHIPNSTWVTSGSSRVESSFWQDGKQPEKTIPLVRK